MISLSKPVSVINGWKNPASNAKNATKYTYLKPASAFDEVLFNVVRKVGYQINF